VHSGNSIQKLGAENELLELKISKASIHSERATLDLLSLGGCRGGERSGDPLV
jgi:hypothetical protein